MVCYKKRNRKGLFDMTQKDQFTAILHEMTSFYRETPARVNHFLKVWSFARQIGRSRKLSE